MKIKLMVLMELMVMGLVIEWYLLMWKIWGKYGEYFRYVGWIMLVLDMVYFRFYKYVFDDDYIYLLWERNVKLRW